MTRVSEVHELSFGKIIKLDADLAEIIVHEGIEIDLAMVDEYHSWLKANLTSPFLVLVNKLHHYTYSFEALLQIGNLPEIKAIAVVSYNPSTDIATDSMISVRKDGWNINTFHGREPALAWLIEQKYATKKQHDEIRPDGK